MSKISKAKRLDKKIAKITDSLDRENLSKKELIDLFDLAMISYDLFDLNEKVLESNYKYYTLGDLIMSGISLISAIVLATGSSFAFRADNALVGGLGIAASGALIGCAETCTHVLHNRVIKERLMRINNLKQQTSLLLNAVDKKIESKSKE